MFKASLTSTNSNAVPAVFGGRSAEVMLTLACLNVVVLLFLLLDKPVPGVSKLWIIPVIAIFLCGSVVVVLKTCCSSKGE